MTNITQAFGAKSGSLVTVAADEWSQAETLIDGGICQLTMVNGVRVLEVL